MDAGDSKPYTRPWPSASPDVGGAAPSGYLSITETIKGTITPILTWTLDSGETTLSPAPDALAVVNVSINASIDGSNGRGTSPQHTSASDSYSTYSDTFVTTNSQTTQITSGTFSHPVQVSSGGSTQVSLPTITLNAACSTDGPNSGGSTIINVVTTPLNIALGGVTVDSGQNKILVGQGCTSSWVIGQGDRIYVTLSDYHWTIPDTTFQSWTVSGDTTHATLVRGPGPTTNPTAHWYWSDDPATKTVTCTATATPPPNMGPPFPVTATQQVSLQIPQTTAAPIPGRVQINNSSPSYSSNGSYLYALYAGAGNGATRGIDWTVQVNTPAPFVPQGASLWNFVQLATPTAWRTPDGGSELPSATNGQSGLDTTYPYEPGPFSATFPGGYPADNSSHTDGDSPGYPVNDAYKTYRVSQNFSTYVMYLPPGSDVQRVPVWIIQWYWNATDTRSDSWSLWDDGTYAGNVRVGLSAKEINHPLWSMLVQAPPAGTF